MDSLSSTKRKIYQIKSLQGQGMLPGSDETETAKTKRRKLETDPLKMGNLLEKILSFLDVNSVKSARRVSKRWSAEGAKVLLTKCFVQIPLDLRVRNSSWFIKNKEMAKFKALLAHKSTEVSMIPNIMIGARGDFELWKSLGVLGPQVKSLKLNFVGGKEDWLTLLLDLLPNLKKLSFDGCYHAKEQKKVMTKFIRSVLSKADENGNPLVISGMILRAESIKEFEEIEKLSDYTNIKFEDLHFAIYAGSLKDVPNAEARIAVTLSKFLSSSQKILKELYLVYCQWYLHLLEFPCLSAVTQMDLHCGNGTSNSPQLKFSPSFRFSEKVPNLHSIAISSGPRSDLFANPFENTGPALSVKRLSLDNVDDTTVNLFQVFPNVEYFLAERTVCSQKMFQSLWIFAKHLKYIDMDIDLDDYDEEMPDLDSFFTGFIPETVRRIKNSPTLPDYSLSELQRWRVNPSILDLTELEEITIYFNRRPESELPYRILAIAGAYAFKFLPNNARVVIRVLDFNPLSERALDAFDEVSELPNVCVDWC